MSEDKKEAAAPRKVPPPTDDEETKMKQLLKEKEEKEEREKVEEAWMLARQIPIDYKRGSDKYEKEVKCTEYKGGYHESLKDANGQNLKNGQGCTATYEDGVIYKGSFLNGKWHSWDHNDKGKLWIPDG